MTNDTLTALRRANVLRSYEWGHTDLSFAAMELGGEAGEALNFCKKLERLRLGMARSGPSWEELIRGLAKELADVVICADLIAKEFDINLGVEIPRKFNETTRSNHLHVFMEEPIK